MGDITRADFTPYGMVQKDEGHYVYFTDHEAEVARLRAEVEKYRVDAERYRWLRDRANEANKSAPMVASNPLGPDVSRLIHADELDAEIDAAMGEWK